MSNLLDLYNTFSAGFGGVNGRLEYPLENQGDYLGRITFTPIDEKRINMLNNIDGILPKSWELIKEYGKLTGNIIDDVIGKESADKREARQPGRPEVKAYAAQRKEIETNAQNQFYGEMTAAPAFDEGSVSLNTNKRISLYLPKAIQIQDTVTYDNAFQLGLIGGAVEAGLKNGAGIVGSAVGAIAGETIGLANTVLGRQDGMSQEAAGILSGKIAAKIPFGEGAAGAIRSQSGLTTNPNTRAIFKDVPLRNFSFAFQLIPTSQNEAIAVEKIIKTFRTELYPVALERGGVNVGYRFPNRFLIKVKYNNREIKGIRFLPVYMQSFNATYNAATGGMHSDGRFSAVDISMTFTETRAISKKDIEGGY
jgi:hypothetical protein